MAAALIVFACAFILGFLCGFTAYAMLLSHAVKKGKESCKDSTYQAWSRSEDAYRSCIDVAATK